MSFPAISAEATEATHEATHCSIKALDVAYPLVSTTIIYTSATCHFTTTPSELLHSFPMARGKKIKDDPAGPAVSKMFRPYVEAAVPAHMGFPPLVHVNVTKCGTTAVPGFNEHQRSWLAWVAVGEVDIGQLEGEALTAFYNKVKIDAFEAKPFRHAAEPGDEAEERTVPVLVQAWLDAHPKYKTKAAKAKKKKKTDGDDADVNESNKEGFLRGYPVAGWKSAIQTWLSRRRDQLKRKANQASNAASPNVKPDVSSSNSVGAVLRLLGFAATTGCHKFVEERHEEIVALAQTLTDDINEGLFVPSPFVKVKPNVTKELVDSMHDWIAGALQDYAKARDGEKAKTDNPTFTLGDDADAISPKDLKQVILQFYEASYEYAFGTRELPWGDIEAKSADFYDETRLKMRLTLTEAFKAPDWYALAEALSSAAGPGTPNLFCKATTGGDGGKPPPHDVDSPPEDEGQSDKQPHDDESPPLVDGKSDKQPDDIDNPPDDNGKSDKQPHDGDNPPDDVEMGVDRSPPHGDGGHNEGGARSAGCGGTRGRGGGGRAGKGRAGKGCAGKAKGPAKPPAKPKPKGAPQQKPKAPPPPPPPGSPHKPRERAPSSKRKAVEEVEAEAEAARAAKRQRKNRA
ncbi:hypothetical protein C8R45DRAFT_1115561 [Mycena sanguinolenta]|nr:hypothetical protein C8R45DRAFT_1115561 [Mycena sanguinolenta]